MENQGANWKYKKPTKKNNYLRNLVQSRKKKLPMEKVIAIGLATC